jgi:alpha-beta hydrolase superfamily lysophospholipase
MNTGVLIVPPFGWDDQTSYRPRRDWSLALADAGFANLRIDLPGTGDSSGSARDHGLVDSWSAAVSSGVAWLRSGGARRVAVIALGAGGLVTLQAIARGTVVDDVVLWGMPLTGRALVREIKAFGRLEQFQTGEQPDDIPDGQLCAGGHLLTRETVAALSKLDAAELIRAAHPGRAMVAGRDGRGPDQALLDALRTAGSDVRTDPGHGWGAALARPQSASPTALFCAVTDWLAECAGPGDALVETKPGSANLGAVQERAVVFTGDGQQLYAIITEPLYGPTTGTAILFNAGAIRRIGPNRMWTEAARRWAAAGVAVIRVDVEGIGDAGGENTPYIAGDESFYVPSLTAQARAALDLAVAEGLPPRFLLAGLCSGAFWAFEAAAADPRVESIVMLNPRLLAFDPDAEGDRELRKLGRLLTRQGLRNLLRERRKLRRIRRFAAHLLKAPARLMGSPPEADTVQQSFRAMHGRGQRIHIAFSGDEPLHEELQQQRRVEELQALGVEFHELPYISHTLKPLKAQQAASAILDAAVAQVFPPMAVDVPRLKRVAASR